MLANAKKPIIYSGGGIINSGKEASHLLREFARMTGFPVTSTLMGLGAYPAADPQWLGMLGMHGTFEANWTMHDCDVMFCIGARFDDRITGRLDAFAPNSRKIHVDIDPSSINKNVKVDLGIVGDCAHVLEDMIRIWRAEGRQPNKQALAGWWKQIDKWRARDCLAYRPSNETIKPQYAIERLYAATKDRDVYITTEVGQHQMWAAQFFKFEEPNRWMTSGGLGTMGYGLPAAIGVQLAHPKSLVIDIAGEASVLMTMQEMSTAAQYRLPIKIFILNNQYMGMVRQWQELLHGGRYSESYSEALPDFVKLAEAYHGVGIRCDKPGDLDHAIKEMINVDKPVIFDCVVDQKENCFPMIPSGKAHNEMLLGRRRRRHREGDRREGQGAGVSNGTPASASHYPAQTVKEKTERHTLSVLVDNEPGVLARVIGLFSGRGYNIDSLTVSETEHAKHLSRITICDLRHADGDRADQAPARAAGAGAARARPDRSRAPSIERELALVKVRGKGDNRVEALRLADAFRAQVIDAGTESFVFEITGATDKIESFINLMLPLGLVEVSRTGVAAIRAGRRGCRRQKRHSESSSARES